jgi:DNA-directed RNA polymerase specialized sigma24 family protein
MGQMPFSLPAEGAFPATRRDWLVERIRAGDEGRRDANAHLMAIYAPALKAYLRGSSYRAFGDADDLVAGFFADRLDRTDFYDRWLASALPLRRWLINGFLFWLREETRARRRAPTADLATAESVLSEDPAADARFEAAWARAAIRRACDRAREVCVREGRETHWTLFLRHHADGVPYADLAAELGVEPSRAPGLARTAGLTLRRALLEMLVREGVPPGEHDREAERLLAALALR